jgi:hypothetical protein
MMELLERKLASHNLADAFYALASSQTRAVNLKINYVVKAYNESGWMAQTVFRRYEIRTSRVNDR